MIFRKKSRTKVSRNLPNEKFILNVNYNEMTFNKLAVSKIKESNLT